MSSPSFRHVSSRALLITPAVVALSVACLPACGDSLTTPDGSAEIDASRAGVLARIVPSSLCSAVPGSLVGRSAYRYEPEVPSFAAPGTLYVAPAHPRPGDEIFVFFSQSYTKSSTNQFNAEVVFTTDGWKTKKTVALGALCALDTYLDLYSVSLGTYSSETEIQFATHYRVQGQFMSAIDGWLNNNGANYAVKIATPPALAWIGDTHLRQSEVFTTPALVIGNHDLQVYTQTYPVGAVRAITLFVSDKARSYTHSIPMTADMDGAGPHQSNTQWRATVDRSKVSPGTAIEYWIKAEDHAGKVLWDSNQSKNYTVTPRTAPVVWAGAFGSYRPSARSYMEGSQPSLPLFGSDFSTSTGCHNHGASISSYVARAIRVYIPGITDRAFASEEDTRAVASLITAEAWTNAHSDRSWGSRPMLFARKVGNDFVYTYFAYTDFCPPSSTIETIPNGDYEYKLRFSTDQGRTWFWRGVQDGPVGGANLRLRFARNCSYFGDPNDCIPN